MLIRFFFINEHGRTVNQNFYPNVHPQVITILLGGFQVSPVMVPVGSSGEHVPSLRLGISPVGHGHVAWELHLLGLCKRMYPLVN
jgi:membrane associated rhomboid family serine protease